MLVGMRGRLVCGSALWLVRPVYIILELVVVAPFEEGGVTYLFFP